MKRAVALALLAAACSAGAAEDPRYCRTEPLRRADGGIARNASVVRQFKLLHPCPATGSAAGSCPGWQIDHVIPLACGGCDAVGNLQWLPNPMKTASGIHAKDRWERPVYCRGRTQ